MIHGKLEQIESLVPVMPEALKIAVQWIRTLDANVEDHRKDFEDQQGMYAQVMRYSTLPAEQTKLECHRRMVDLQYTISGSEGIGWLPLDGLQTKADYSEEKDAKFFHFQTPECVVWQKPGRFTILTPEDAHCPKIRMPGEDSVVKLVVKIPLTLWINS